MKSPIAYYGGKQRMSSKIVPLIPKHTVYVEPFCGGATILFAKPWPDVTNNDHYREVINDKDSRLVNFFRQLRDNGDKLCELIALTPYSREEHQVSLWEGLDCEDKLEAARRYFVNSQTSFSNTLNAGWGTGVFTVNLAVTWRNKIINLPEYISRIQSVHIENEDALKVIKRWDSPQTFFYCDPPYPNTKQGHYSGYTLDDYKSLISSLDNCQGSFLLSNYIQDVDIPEDWEKLEFHSYCSASTKGKVGSDRSKKATSVEIGNRKRTEVVYRRFNRIPVREEIQKLYDSGKFDCFV